MSKTGGHLGSSLGVVELTVALHYVFDAPEDKIIWDVAHQVRRDAVRVGREVDRTGYGRGAPAPALTMPTTMPTAGLPAQDLDGPSPPHADSAPKGR